MRPFALIALKVFLILDIWSIAEFMHHAITTFAYKLLKDISVKVTLPTNFTLVSMLFLLAFHGYCLNLNEE
jgi:hypothetical protein